MDKQNRNVALLTIKNELKDLEMNADTEGEYSESALTTKEVDSQSEESVKVLGIGTFTYVLMHTLRHFSREKGFNYEI